MQVDTGATCSVMARAVYEEMFGELKGARDQVKPCLSAYGGGGLLSVSGKVEVEVQY